MRGSRADVIRPYVPAVSVLLGSLKFVWLSKLKNSPRNCNFTLSVMGKYFAMAKSTLARPGPNTMLRPDFPYVQVAACPKAFVLNHSNNGSRLGSGLAIRL